MRCTMCNTVKPFSQFSKDRQRELGLKWRCKQCDADEKFLWYHERGGKQNVESQHRKHASRLRRTYRITVDRYERLLQKQHGRCYLCNKKSPNRRLAIDHDHRCCATATSCGYCIRGLLCSPCNTSLGSYEKMVDTFGIDAIERYRQRRVEGPTIEEFKVVEEMTCNQPMLPLEAS